LNRLRAAENQNQESRKARNFFRVVFFAMAHGTALTAGTES
jgi:hypothetical protein